MTYEERVLKHKHPDELIEVRGMKVCISPIWNVGRKPEFYISSSMDLDPVGTWGDMVELARAILNSENTRIYHPQHYRGGAE